MNDKLMLYLRIAAAVLFLAAGVWSTIYLVGLPFNGTTTAMCALLAALWLLLAWLLLRGHPGRLIDSTPGFIVAGFFFGMVLVAPAAATNSSAITLKDWLGLSNLQFGMLSPITEELLKFTTVFVLCTAVFRIRRPIEAVVVGIAVGFGFSAVEDATYVLQGALESLNSDVLGSLTGVGIRTITAPWNHSINTGLAAWGLGQFLCRTDKTIGWRTAQLIGWYLVGYACHAIFNSAGELPDDIAPIAVFFAKLLLAWVGGPWLYLRSRKIGRRDLPDGRSTAAQPA